MDVALALTAAWAVIVLGCCAWYVYRRHAPRRRWKRPERVSAWDWLGLLLAGVWAEPGIGPTESGRTSSTRRPRKKRPIRRGR